MTLRSFFGALIVVVLLVLYFVITRSAIHLLGCDPQPVCLESFSETKASALALIGGLVSAVVIAELAVTEPGSPPGRSLLREDPSPWQYGILHVITFLYLIGWLFVGLWSVVATWNEPDAIPALTAVARSWFGLAVAAGYAYFGLTPKT